MITTATLEELLAPRGLSPNMFGLGWSLYPRENPSAHQPCG